MRGRVFVEANVLEAGAPLTLSPTESHYLVRVRRATAGDAIEVLDGVAARHRGVVDDADPKACRITVGDPVVAVAPPRRLVLMAIVDAKAVAEALTGASEAGATELVAVRTQRAAPSLPSPQRLHKIVHAAQRQCGRARPLAIRGPVALPDALDEVRAAAIPGWVCALQGGPAPSLSDGAAAVLVGPEGGLTDQEIERALTAGFEPLGLGPHVQRTPTAIISALARLHPCA